MDSITDSIAELEASQREIEADLEFYRQAGYDDLVKLAEKQLGEITNMLAFLRFKERGVAAGAFI